MTHYIWIKTFEILKERIGYENAKQYFYINKSWPQLEYKTYLQEDHDMSQEIKNMSLINKDNFKDISTFYHFLNFMFSNHII